MNLSGRTALITGGGKGIGGSISLALAGAGCDIVVNYAHDAASADSMVERIRKSGPKAISVKADVCNMEEVDAMADIALKEFGKIDILVNNAGNNKDGFLTLMPQDDWKSVIETNLTGVFNCCQVVSKAMISKRYGRIINMSSISGLMGIAGQTNYSAAKAGVIGLTKALAKELVHFKILVNAVAPGLIDTEMIKKIPAKNLKEMLNNIPLKRLGKPEEVAEVVVFLASESASYMTGQVLTVSGGL